MNRVEFVEHQGIRILHADFSGIQETRDLQRAVRIASEFAQSQPLSSLLILVDVTNVEYNLETFAVVQQAVVANRPYVRARAIVGLPRVASIPFEVVARLSGSPMAKFDTVESAKVWLVAQASKGLPI